MSFVGHYKGLVEQVGGGGDLGKVKVRFPHLDGLVSDWLPVAQPLNLGASAWAVPRAGSQVIVLPGESPHAGLEDAVVIGGIYSRVDRPPFQDTKIIGLKADDGVEISYDPSKSRLTVKAPVEVYIEAEKVNVKAANAEVSASQAFKVAAGQIDLTAAGPFRITAPTVAVTGNVTVAGNISAAGGAGGGGMVEMVGNVKITGSTIQNGTLAVTEALVGGVPVSTHRHAGVQSGPAITTGPLP